MTILCSVCSGYWRRAFAGLGRTGISGLSPNSADGASTTRGIRQIWLHNLGSRGSKSEEQINVVLL